MFKIIRPIKGHVECCRIDSVHTNSKSGSICLIAENFKSIFVGDFIINLNKSPEIFVQTLQNLKNKTNE